MTAEAVLVWLDAAGVIVFAITGALVASRKELDIVGFMFIGSVTGVGGGTLRDLLLDRPVFWVGEPYYLLLTCGAAVTVYFAAPMIESRYKVLLWADALGLALYCVMGADIALQIGHGLILAVVMGTMTATVGGLIRDVICQETPLVLRREIYATAAAAGAATYAGLRLAAADGLLAAVTAASVAFAIRAAALHFNLAVPVYRSRPGRDYPPR